MFSVTRRSLPAAFGVVAVLAAPGLLVAQGNPLGPEFRVNSYTTDVQFFPSVAFDSTGNFVVAWESYTQDGSDFGIFAQRYADSGAPLGGEFRVNTVTTSNQRFPAVASDAAGNFVVAWFSADQDGSGNGIFGQRFASNGAPLGPEFRINTYTTGNQFTPQVASDSAGNFVVVWYSAGQDGFIGYGVFGQRVASNGAALGPEFQINTYTPYNQFPTSVASDSAGNFVVVWFGDFQDGSGEGIFGQRYASTGVPQGGEFRVNTYTTGNQFTPAVASDAAGNFVVAWYSPQDGSGYGMFGQRFASNGAPLGGEFQINTFTTNNQFGAAVASDSAGNFVVAWEGDSQDGSGFGIFGQRYASTGGPLGGEFRVNTYTTADQRVATVASDPAGHFVVAWESYNEDGSLTGIFAQRFSMVVPVELLGCTVE